MFVTGTDTGVGKTVVTALLARFLTERGIDTITQKWVQTGCKGPSSDIAAHMEFVPGGRDLLKKHGKHMAPYVLGFPSSPHLAADLEKIEPRPKLENNKTSNKKNRQKKKGKEFLLT